MGMKSNAFTLATLFLGTAGFSTFGESARADTILNGSFESPIIGPPTYSAAPNNYVYPNGPLGNWIWSTPSTANGSFDGSGIINASGSSNWWGALPPPTGFDGNQFAFVQGQGSFSQTFVAAFSGQFSVSWLEGSRQDMRRLNASATFDGDQLYEVLINGSILGTYSTLSGQNFESENSSSIHLNAGTSYTLEFKGLTTLGDHTSFIDMVSVNGVADAVPGPTVGAGLPGLIAAFGALLAWRRRRTSKFSVA